MGRGFFNMVASGAAFWLVAAPFALAGALTDAFTSRAATKLVFCVGYTSIAQAINAVVFNVYLLCCVDWPVVAKMIATRANTDKTADSTVEGSAAGLGGCQDDQAGVAPLVLCAHVQEGASDVQTKQARE